MPLASGARLGPYEIVAPLGAGGMGEVYKARDTRLDRTVALKILSDALAADPQFRERFEREAKTISQLSHTNICTLFDVGEAPSPQPSALSHDTVRFLVMEFLEGETLAERLVKVSTLKPQVSGLPVDQALTIATQVAAALDCAHRAGVVHRDLKPGNIFLTAGGAKLLDFGLAKNAVQGFRPGVSGAAANLSSPPTMTTPLTGQGTIIGTFQYMSPEQLEGKDVDARADTFAFGAVLFEMLTGRRAFQGKTQFTVMGAILEHDPPPVSTVAASVPPALDRVVQKCLAKDPAKRWQSMADLADELRWIAEQRPATSVAATSTGAAAATAAPTRTTRRRIIGTVKGVAIAAASGLATWAIIRLLPTGQPQPVHFAIVPPSAQGLALQGADRDVTITPDGTRIVYRAGSGQQQMMVRAIDQLEARPLAGITGFRAPFISPDSHWVGFFDEAELKKVSITGGPPISLCRFAGATRGASWGPDDTIIFATADPSTGLLQVPAAGGEPKALTKPDAGHGEGDHLFPSFLPGGRAVLFTITGSGQAENSQIAVLDLKSGQRKTLVRGGTNGEFVGPSTSSTGSRQAGYLVYAAAGTLRAVRFDPARLEVLSDPVPVVERVMTSGTGAANFAVSRNGTLLYVPGAGSAGARRALVWVDRQGREETVNLPPRAYIAVRLSPDGTRIALDIRDQENDIWVWDLGRRTLTRLTFDPAPDQYPVWTPDGRRIIFNSARAGVANLYWQGADGTGTAERLTTSPNAQAANSISPDGTRVVLTETSPKTGIDLFVMPLDGPRRPEPLIATQFPETNADISPDGRWIAYQSSESGQNQVYVRPFPHVEAGRWQLSTGGGSRPVWAKSGRELFYLEGNNALMTVPVQTTGSTFSAGNPARLFEGHYLSGPAGRLYDVTREGQRFLMIKDNAGGDQTAAPPSIVVVLNWVEELRQRVPSR